MHKGMRVAHLHFHRTVYKAGSDKAADRIEYMTGRTLTERNHATRQLRYLREGREDLVEEGTRNLPGWAESPHTYFQAAERFERQSPNNDQRRGVAFEEWKISLPQEFSQEQNLALTRDLLDTIAGDRLPCTYAFHQPTTMDTTKKQPHLHLLISARMQDGISRSAEQHFKRWNKDHPERGGAPKDAMMNHKGAVKAHRVQIADLLNLHLEHHGMVARVHPDTLESRGLDRPPEPKLRPSESRAYRDRGVISARMQEVLDIRAHRVTQWAKEQLQARAYWEGRKSELAITREAPSPARLQAITQARAHRRDHAPERQAEPPRLARGRQTAPPIARTPPKSVTNQTRDRVPPPRHRSDLASQVKRLAQQLAQDEEARNGPLHVRLHDHEREQGMGF
jgi:hypothetical protein